MPFDASGNFTRAYNFVQDAANGIKILAARVDGEFDNLATGMNLVFFRDGRVPMQADLRMNINGITGLKDGALGSPAIKFNTDPNTGPYLPGLNQYGIQVNSLQRLVATTAGVDVTGNLTASGTIMEGGTLLSSKYLPTAGPTFTGNLTGPIHVASGATGSYTIIPRDASAGNTTIYSNTANTLRIALNGTDQFVLSPSAFTVTPPATFSGAVTVTGAFTTNSNATTNGTLTANGQLTVTNTGGSGANLQFNGNGSTTPSKTLRVNSGKLEFVNSAYSQVIASLDDGGGFAARDILASRGDGTGVLYFGSTASSNYIHWDGTGYNFQAAGPIRANNSGFSATGVQGTYNVGFSNSRTGSVGYHMYNGGAVVEWIMYQPAGATGHDFRIGRAVAGSVTDSFKIGTDNNCYAQSNLGSNGEIWTGLTTSTGILRFGSGGSGSGNYLQYDGTQFQLSKALTVAGNITSTSDARLKSNVHQLYNGMDMVRAFQPKRFTMYGKDDFGFIAQELMPVAPQVVSVDNKGYMSVDYGRLTAVLTGAIQTLDERLSAVEKLLAL